MEVAKLLKELVEARAEFERDALEDLFAHADMNPSTDSSKMQVFGMEVEVLKERIK